MQKDSLLISVIKWMSILLRLMIDYKNKEKFLKLLIDKLVEHATIGMKR